MCDKKTIIFETQSHNCFRMLWFVNEALPNPFLESIILKRDNLIMPSFMIDVNFFLFDIFFVMAVCPMGGSNGDVVMRDIAK